MSVRTTAETSLRSGLNLRLESEPRAKHRADNPHSADCHAPSKRALLARARLAGTRRGRARGGSGRGSGRATRHGPRTGRGTSRSRGPTAGHGRAVAGESARHHCGRRHDLDRV